MSRTGAVREVVLSGPTAESDPAYWPEAPFDASYHHDEGWFGWQGHGWTVPHEPPGGFPFIDPPFPRSLYGPSGTRWIFTTADVLAGLVGIPGGVATSVLNRALRKLGVTFGEGSLMGWTTPENVTQPIGGHMRWIHATIIGALGTTEQVAHTLNFRTAPTADADQDAAAVLAFAGQIRDNWVTFLNATASGASKIQQYLTSDLVYKEVRAAYLEQTAPASITTKQGKTGPVKVFNYPRPAYLVETQYAPFAAGVAGTGSSPSLPWEVAMCVSTGSGLRGPRNRGRTYLGPFTTSAVVAGGLYDATIAQSVQTAFGAFVHNLNTTTGNRLHIVSRAYATSVGVNSVRVGRVPDSQRRRRRGQPELYPTQTLT